MGVNRPLKKVEINIDKAKKEREVAEIVESDDFKLLEQQANKLRQKSEKSTESQLEAETQERSARRYPSGRALPNGFSNGVRSSAPLSPFSEETAIAQPAEPELVAPEPQSKAKTPPSLNPEFLENCRQELARCIGPFASVLLKETLAQSPHLTPEQLVEALTAEIPDPQRSGEFRRHIKIPPQSLSETEAPLNATFSEQKTNAHPARLNPEFLEHCRQELMHCTGPMADVLLKDTLAQSPHLAPEQLVEALAAEIPDPQQAQEFKNRLKIL